MSEHRDIPCETSFVNEWTGRNASRQRFLRLVHEVNERCIEMMQSAARAAAPTPAWPEGVRDLLVGLHPAARRTAARRGLLLVDLNFSNASWWLALMGQPGQGAKPLAGAECFGRRPAIQLARATLMCASQAVRWDRESVGILVGLAPGVADVLDAISLKDIEMIAERQFRCVRPRWLDRPLVWRQLLLAAQAEDAAALRNFNLQAIQLSVGELLA